MGWKAYLPRAYGPWEGKLYIPWANFWRFFQPLGWRNFYTWHPAHSEIPYFFGKECSNNTFSLEIRRSGRLRGLQPEYEGLDHTKRTRTPRKTQPKFLDLTETTANTSVSLEELLKPRYTSYTSAVFAYFGFYDEAEIARRRSLRLQGLDPEFEGLTWGQR